jgi:hypothetical protein
MNPAEFVLITGMMGKFIGLDEVEISYVEESYQPEFFKSVQNQKIFANLLLLLEENIHTVDSIRQEPKCGSVFDLILYRIIRIISHRVKEGNAEFDYPSLLQVLLICSNNLSVGYFPDKKIIPISHKYERPPEVLLDKAWNQEVKHVLDSITQNMVNIKIKNLVNLTDGYQRINAFDENILKTILDSLKTNMNYIKENSYDSIYVVNRLSMILSKCPNTNEELNGFLKSTLSNCIDDYLSQLDKDKDKLIQNYEMFNQSNLSQKTLIKSENARINSNLNKFLSNYHILRKIGIQNSKADSLFKEICGTMLGLVDNQRIPDVIEFTQSNEVSSEFKENVLNRLGNWVDTNNIEWSSFKILDKNTMQKVKENVISIIKKDKLSTFEYIIFAIEHQLDISSKIAN